MRKVVLVFLFLFSFSFGVVANGANYSREDVCQLYERFNPAIVLLEEVIASNADQYLKTLRDTL